ncbi:MAG: hypothetical protein L3J93_00715 [Thermoplasmata archaeon]|nr:hypothetical protein [Thermoplasmata archaeon]
MAREEGRAGALGARSETFPAPRRVGHPGIAIGSPKEYAVWMARLRRFLVERGVSPDEIEQVDARYNYGSNRITLYRLPRPGDGASIAETISHEFLHALLFQLGESWAARAIDLVGKPVGNPARIGGI